MLARGTSLFSIGGVNFRFTLVLAPVRICARVVVRSGEFVHLLLRGVLGDAVAFLNFANKLFFLAGDHCQIIIGKLSPFFFYSARGLLPLALDCVPVHNASLGALQLELNSSPPSRSLDVS